MFCQKCGKELRDGSAFCDGCGASLNGDADKQQAAPTPTMVNDSTVKGENAGCLAQLGFIFAALCVPLLPFSFIFDWAGPALIAVSLFGLLLNIFGAIRIRKEFKRTGLTKLHGSWLGSVVAAVISGVIVLISIAFQFIF